MSFDRALEIVLSHEGGFSNHPEDPGGATMMGVTKQVWEAWVGKPVSVKEMRALTFEDVKPLYRTQYWDVLRADEMPRSVAICVFDFAVNAGVSRAARYFQRIVGSEQDGIIGRYSIDSMIIYFESKTVRSLIEKYQDMRRSYYRILPHFKEFGNGWLARVDDIEKQALESLG